MMKGILMRIVGDGDSERSERIGEWVGGWGGEWVMGRGMGRSKVGDWVGAK